MLKIKELAQNLINTIEWSDHTFGVGDRPYEENKAIQDLKIALKEDECSETSNN